MKASEVFGIVVRTFGLLLIPVSLWWLMGGLGIVLLGWTQEDPGEWIYFLVGGGLLAALAVWCMRGTPQIIHFAYPQKQDPTETEKQD